MVASLAEISEAEATGKIKTAYEDIKATLRTPVVSLIWRSLAVEPDYLLLAWTALKPNLQTAYFERRADDVRLEAVRAVTSWGTPPQTPPDAAGAIQVFHYLNPKLFLALAALRSATHGQQPRLVELMREDKRQIRPGVPPEAVSLDMFAPESATSDVGVIFSTAQETVGLPATPCEFRVLAKWPDYLRAAWTAVEGNVRTSSTIAAMRSLRNRADETVGSLPYRMDIGPHVMRQSGLSELQIDAVQDRLSRFYTGLSTLTLWSAFLAGKEAQASPYPATLQ